ncbi:MAG: AmmeMemoRadiSam system radical SAM enzyme [Victivallales bacterium]|nr:AmmeMemoRadiSam system radical SAM enzyme [Victivallales bacterium]
MQKDTVARWWTASTDGKVQCELCPRHCVISEGKTGYCAVRRNVGGKLMSLSYGHPVSAAIDPIEKKPLARFMPGTRTFSFGTFGCNLGCVFCQNDWLSRGDYDRNDASCKFIAPEQIVQMALMNRCPSISFTYNEPTVFAEYANDIARMSHDAGLKNVLVSNGYINELPSQELYPLIDAANIDMKGFCHGFYPEMCQATLEPVLDSILRLYNLGKHIEITTLVIPEKNDDDFSVQQWLDWVQTHLDMEVPLHFSAYHPAYKCRIPSTPAKTLYHIREICIERGFKNVFLGNI